MSGDQTIFLADRTERDKWAQILNDTIRDNRMSFKATGLLVYLLSLPPDWKANQQHIATCKKDGRDSVISAWNELRDLGYIQKEIIREAGQIVTTIWKIFEIPRKEPVTGFPETAKPETAFPKSVNPILRTTKGNEKPKETKPVALAQPFLFEFDASMPYPKTLNTPEFRQAWADYEAFRKSARFAKLQPISIQEQFAAMAQWGHAAAIDQIRESIRQGWQGIFPPKKGAQSKQIKTVPLPPHELPPIMDFEAEMKIWEAEKAKQS